MEGEAIAIIPAYDEELTIGSVVLETKKHVAEVLVVDDGPRIPSSLNVQSCSKMMKSFTSLLP